jgi:hypothetical protein
MGKAVNARILANYSVGLVSVMCVVQSARAQTLTWLTSKAEVMALARAQGKLVLLLAGRTTCGYCNYMRNTVCETTSPPIKQTIQAGFVPWFCDIDASTDWYPYASGLGSFYLPLMCCLDPGRPNNYLDRSTYLQYAETFHPRLQNQPLATLTNAAISRWVLDNGQSCLVLSNLTAWATNHVERCQKLERTNTWVEAARIISTTRTTNWTETLPGSNACVFYRVRTRR